MEFSLNQLATTRDKLSRQVGFACNSTKPSRAIAGGLVRVRDMRHGNR
jgi:hypothetical protein